MDDSDVDIVCDWSEIQRRVGFHVVLFPLNEVKWNCIE